MEFSATVFTVRYSALCRKKQISPRKALKEIFNVDGSNLPKWRNNDSVPNARLIFDIAEYFNVSADYLLGREIVSEISSVDRYTPEEYDLIISLRKAGNFAREAAISAVRAILDVEDKQKEMNAAEESSRSIDGEGQDEPSQ